MSDMRIRTTP